LGDHSGLLAVFFGTCMGMFYHYDILTVSWYAPAFLS